MHTLHTPRAVDRVADGGERADGRKLVRVTQPDCESACMNTSLQRITLASVTKLGITPARLGTALALHIEDVEHNRWVLEVYLLGI